MLQPGFIEIDLSETTEHGGNGIEVGPTYLILHAGRFYTGKFSPVWYGLNFWSGQTSYQYAPPGVNLSSFQRIWRMINADQIAKESEMEYATVQREYCIKHKMKSNGQTIDETTPIEAYMYDSQVPAMPELEEDDD